MEALFLLKPLIDTIFEEKYELSVNSVAAQRLRKLNLVRRTAQVQGAI